MAYKISRVLGLALLTTLFAFFPEKSGAQTSPQNNTWYSLTSSDTVFIFVHGIFSNANDCWKSSGNFWPKILKEDMRFNGPSIFLGGYSTDFSSGIYRINNAAEELLSYLSVSDASGNPAPLSKPAIIFVAHSTGGLVVRYLLERYQELFREKTVGLVLLASPSRGSEWSNRLEWLHKLFKNKMAGQLARDNDSVVDLDVRFADLVHQRRIPKLVGIDAFEHKFIIPGILFNTENVVSASDSASYFGAYKILPNTDHFSIAKPVSPSDPSHHLLWEFYEKRFKAIASIKEPVKPAETTASPPSFEIKDRQHPCGVKDYYHPGVTSTEVCERLCAGDPACTVYVYSRKYNGCYLKIGQIADWFPWEEGFSGRKK